MNQVLQTRSLNILPKNQDSNFKVERPLFILPTYNEADNITQILDAIEALPISISVLVVDDSSPDGTADYVRRHP